MEEFIQAELALRSPIDEAAESMFTPLKQELEDYFGNPLLPLKDSNEDNAPF
jgi:hypothetical protein